jgi:hypothetical protein
MCNKQTINHQPPSQAHIQQIRPMVSHNPQSTGTPDSHSCNFLANRRCKSTQADGKISFLPWACTMGLNRGAILVLGEAFARPGGSSSGATVVLSIPLHWGQAHLPVARGGIVWADHHGFTLTLSSSCSISDHATGMAI